jgi:DNA polymerase III sliding clamp (beta) subunit (PCNA family)
MVQVAELREWIEAVRDFVEEPTLVKTDEGLKIVGMDPSHVVLVDAVWKTSEIDIQQPITVNANDVVKLLKGLEGEVDVKVEDKRLKIVNDVFRLELPILDSVGGNVPKPKLSFEARLEVSAAELAKAVSKAAEVSDYCRLTAKKNGELVLSAKNDLYVFEQTLKPEKFEAEKEVRASFSLTYLGNIVKTLKRVAEKTTLEYATNKPLRFEAENEKLKIEFMVAPRID